MKIKLLALFFLPLIAFSQNFTVNNHITVAAGIGNYHPQIEVMGDNKLGIIWTDAAGDDLYFVKQTGIDEFGTPLQLNPSGLAVQDYNWCGADLATWQNDTYVIFRSLGFETGHIYVVKSSDSGESFGDTVRVDNLTVGYAQFPDIAIYNDTVFVVMMVHDDNSGTNPQYALTRSFDGGLTFDTPVVASAIVGNEACDCCQPEIVVDDKKVMIFFRNNNSNTREIKASISYDRGATFSDWISVDDHNLVLASCPSSGADARLTDGDRVISAYRTAVGGVGKVFLNEYNVTTDVSENMIDVYMDGIANTGINYPQLAYYNGAIGIVWEALGQSTDIYFNASITGVTGITPSNAINVTDTSGSQSKPDITILNGQYHIVYTQLTGNEVKYVRIGSLVDLPETKDLSWCSLFPNPTKDIAELKFTENVSGEITVKIYSVKGDLVQIFNQPVNGASTKLDLSSLENGNYIVHVSLDNKEENFRITKQ